MHVYQDLRMLYDECTCVADMLASEQSLAPADSLLAAFTPPADPSTAPFVTPRSLPPHPSPSNNSSAAARRAIDPGCKTDGQAVAAGIDRASDLESEAYAWQENVRLSQEALTLLRVLLVDSVLGGSYNCLRVQNTFFVLQARYALHPFMVNGRSVSLSQSKRYLRHATYTVSWSATADAKCFACFALLVVYM